MEVAPFVGCWRLKEFVIVRPSGDRDHPYGPDAEGLLMYTPDGWVSAVLSERDRTVATVRRLESASRVSADEKVRAFDSYMSYAGRYHWTGTTVVHEIVVALAPGLVGTEMSRVAHFDGDRLDLSFDVVGRSGTSSYQLRWVRPE